MHIFIDESGTFTIPTGADRPAISCVGALLLPSDELEATTAAFTAMAAPWADSAGEVKGRNLNEAQFDAFLRFLAQRKGLVVAAAVDMALHRVAEVNEHRDEQARRLTAGLTPEHHPDLKAAVHELAVRLRRLKVPNYSQLVVYTRVVESILRTAMMYVVQHRPADLGVLDWTLDAKGHSVTEMEDLWRTLVRPFLQSSSLSAPMAVLDWCDYSAFDAAFQSDSEGLPKHLAPHVTPVPRMRSRPLDLRRVMARLQFASSAATPGLQMADVVTSCIRRMLTGNLQPSGWMRLGEVMLQPMRELEAVAMLSLSPKPRSWDRAPYGPALRVLRASTIPILPD